MRFCIFCIITKNSLLRIEKLKFELAALDCVSYGRLLRRACIRFQFKELLLLEQYCDVPFDFLAEHVSRQKFKAGTPPKAGASRLKRFCPR